MADPEPGVDPNSPDDADATVGRGPTTGTPRWMRALWIVILIGMVALVIALHLTGTLGPGAH